MAWVWPNGGPFSENSTGKLVYNPEVLTPALTPAPMLSQTIAHSLSLTLHLSLSLSQTLCKRACLPPTFPPFAGVVGPPAALLEACSMLETAAAPTGAAPLFTAANSSGIEPSPGSETFITATLGSLTCSPASQGAPAPRGYLELDLYVWCRKLPC